MKYLIKMIYLTKYWCYDTHLNISQNSTKLKKNIIKWKELVLFYRVPHTSRQTLFAGTIMALAIFCVWQILCICGKIVSLEINVLSWRCPQQWFCTFCGNPALFEAQDADHLTWLYPVGDNKWGWPICLSIQSNTHSLLHLTFITTQIVLYKLTSFCI